MGQLVSEYNESAFVLYHAACIHHKRDEAYSQFLFDACIKLEQLNFFYGVNQLLFHLQIVYPPAPTLDLIVWLFKNIKEHLSKRQQMLVLRFFLPPVKTYIECFMNHDKLLKYSKTACKSALDAAFKLIGPYLPGGDQVRPECFGELPGLCDL